MGVFRVLGREAAAQGSTGLYGLEPLLTRDTAPTSKTISPRVIPMGTSMRPALFTLPAMAKVLVPLLFSVPILANQLAPFRKISRMLARVSTLLTEVGLPHRPDWAGKGGRGLGSPRRLQCFR